MLVIVEVARTSIPISLDAAEFEEMVTEHVASRVNMRPVHDLNEWDHKPGIYVMVLDDYRESTERIESSTPPNRSRSNGFVARQCCRTRSLTPTLAEVVPTYTWR
jgi:hypothetical protein